MVDEYSNPPYCKKQDSTKISEFAAIALNSANPGEIVRCGFVGVHYISDEQYSGRITDSVNWCYASLHAGMLSKNIMYIDWTMKRYTGSTFEIQHYNGNNTDTTSVVTFIYKPEFILHVPGYPRGLQNMSTYGMTSLIYPDVSNVDEEYQNTMYTIYKNGSLKTVIGKQNQISGFESNNYTNCKFSVTCSDSDWQAVFNSNWRGSFFIGFYNPLFTYSFDWFEDYQ